MAFPLTPVPSYYTTVTHTGRSGVYYVGDTISVTLSSSNPTDYYVKDYYGNTVETGHINSTTLNLVGPFNPGWYRVYMTGASTDTTFGPSYGAWSFIVIPVDSRFVTNPAPGVDTTQAGGESHDTVFKGVLGIGTSRIQITNASSPGPPDGLGPAEINGGWSATYYTQPNDPAFDPNRPRHLFLQFPNKTYDRVSMPASSGTYLNFYIKDLTVDGSKVYVQGTATGGQTATINVYYPDSATLVETYSITDSTTGSATINGASAYIRAFVPSGNGTTATSLATTVIGNAFTVGVQTQVATLFPYGYTYFEGPFNEGAMNAETAHQMKLFQAGVHAGNADAKAIGPCFVDISTLTGNLSWTTFLAAGGGDYCDEFSTHMYNSQTNGDINLGRTKIEGWKALTASYGYSDKPVWHTEATHVWVAVAGVHHPRRSRVPLLQTLLMEQYGIPREKNLVWYDRSHGFWSYPAWLSMNSGPTPYAALYRTLAAETFGMTHYHRLDFGCEPANRIWLGSLYVQNKNTLGPSCLVLAMNSYMPSATVDLTITGTSANITYVDAFGNTATATNSGGVVTIPTSDIPTYVRLPAGVTATVHQVNDWGTSPSPSISSYGSASSPVMNDDGFMTTYSTVGTYISTGSLPEAAQIMFLANATFQRVIVFCGGTWQNLSGLTTFTVDTWDGTSWTTQKTVDVSAGCVSFQHGSDSNGEGCKQETYWPEQWIFDVKFAAPVTAQGVRVNASAASYGGEPDAAAKAAGGQGAAAPHLTLQEIMVPSASTPGF